MWHLWPPDGDRMYLKGMQMLCKLSPAFWPKKITHLIFDFLMTPHITIPIPPNPEANEPI